ncbi:MAG TPA: hypothetical protein VGM65_02125 [Candidatus Udaeobacter sp.]|jgi:hypothetical protein
MIAAIKSPILSCAIILTLSLGALSAVYADSATWSMNPISDNWSTSANWIPNTVPHRPSDTASFAVSSETSVGVRRDIEVSETIFNASASDYTITVYPSNTFTVSGQGVINDSGTVQNFVAVANQTEPGTINFMGTASAGDAVFTLEPPPKSGDGNQGGLVQSMSNRPPIMPFSSSSVPTPSLRTAAFLPSTTTPRRATLLLWLRRDAQCRFLPSSFR